MAGRADRSHSPPDYQGTLTDPEDLRSRIRGSYRHVQAASDSSSVSTSASSLSDNFIVPDDSASGPPNPHRPQSHSSHRPAARRAADDLSRVDSRAASRDRDQSDRRGPRRAYSRERVRTTRRTVERTPYPDHSPPPARAPYQRQSSLSSSSGSLDSETTTSYDSHSTGHPPPGPRYHPGFAPHPRSVRRPSDDYYGAGAAALVPMGHYDPYHGRHYGRPDYYPHHDPYYGHARPQAQPAPAFMGPPPGYQGQELVARPPPQYYYPQPQPQPMYYPPAPGSAAPTPPAASTPVAAPAPSDDPVYRQMQEELKLLKEEKDRQERAKREAAAAEVARLQEFERLRLAEEKEKKIKSDAEAAAKAKVEKDFTEKAVKAKSEADKAAEEAKKKFDELEKKKKAADEELKVLKGDPDSKKAPVRILDGVLDRKFDFPWPISKSWNGTHKLLEQAFENWPELALRIRDKRFDLVGPDRQLLLPSIWDSVVQPGWEVTLLMAPDAHHHHHHGGHAGAIVDGGHKHKSSSKDKHKSSKDKKKHSSSSSSSKKHKKPEIIDGGFLDFPPGAFAAANTTQPLFGDASLGLPPVPTDGLREAPAALIEGKKHKSSKRQSNMFLFGKRK